VSTYTYAESFTRVHARRLSGRVTTDLRQSYILYDRPSAASLEDYRVELEELLLGGYVEQYQFGFKKESRIVWSLRYIVRPDGALTGGAGGVPVGVDASDATRFNYLTQPVSWYLLGDSAREAIESSLPFPRVVGSLPSDAHGYWENNKSYAAGGVGLQRAVFRSWS